MDQYGNVETGFSGTKTLTFSELSNSGSGAVATVTNASLTAVKQGMATAITFTEGVSSAGGVLTAYDAQTATLAATDGTLSTSTTAGSTVTLTVSPAASSAYTIAPISSTQTAGASYKLTITLVDQYQNVETSFSGNKNLTFAGLGASPGGTKPTVTNQSGNSIALGTATTISFTNGASSGGGLLTVYGRQAAVYLSATDGILSTTTSGGTRAQLNVQAATASAYRIVAVSTTPTVGGTDQLTITQVDQYQNVETGLSGVVNLTFSGLSASPNSTVATVTRNSATAVAEGTATAITFTNGVNIAGGLLVAYDAQTAILAATDGSVSTAGNGGIGVALTIATGAANAISVSSGNTQSATVVASFKNALVVLVVDKYGNPVSGRSVTFTAPATTTAASGKFNGGVSQVAVNTNSQGLATSTTLTADTVAGTFSVNAMVAGATTPATFSLTNLADPPNELIIGQPASSTVGQNYVPPLSVRVTDYYGNVISGATVTFTAPASGPSGTFSGSRTATATTNAKGVATAPAFTANTKAGSFLLTLSIPGVRLQTALSDKILAFALC